MPTGDDKQTPHKQNRQTINTMTNMTNTNNNQNMSTKNNNTDEIEVFDLSTPPTEEEIMAEKEMEYMDMAKRLKRDILHCWDPDAVASTEKREPADENAYEKEIREGLNRVNDLGYNLLPGEVKQKEDGTFTIRIDPHSFSLEQLIDAARNEGLTDEEWENVRRDMINDLKVLTWEEREEKIRVLVEMQESDDELDWQIVYRVSESSQVLLKRQESDGDDDWQPVSPEEAEKLRAEGKLSLRRHDNVKEYLRERLEMRRKSGGDI